MLSLLKRHEPRDGSTDEVESLSAQIAVAQEAMRTALAEAERLTAASLAELDDDRSEELLRQARAQERAARRAEANLPELLEQHATAIWQRRRAAFEWHKHRVESAARAVIDAMERAAAANATAVEAFQAARTEFGSVVEQQFPRIYYNGIPLPDLVSAWRRDAERQLDDLASLDLPRTQPRATSAVAATPLPTGMPTAPKPTIRSVPAPAAPKPENAMTPHPVRLGDGPEAAPLRERNPDDLDPLAPGELRVRVLRAGFSPADDRSQTDAGQIIRMPEEAARRAAASGAVEIIAETSA